MKKIKKEVDLYLTDDELSTIYNDTKFIFYPSDDIEGYYFFDTKYFKIVLNIHRKKKEEKCEKLKLHKNKIEILKSDSMNIEINKPNINSLSFHILDKLGNLTHYRVILEGITSSNNIKVKDK